MFQYIDNESSLLDYLEQVKTADWVALDTEFIREKTYYPGLCLIQLATTETMVCIDPLQLPMTELQPLLDWLQEPQLTKVLHAAGQDLEVFHHITGKVPAPVFDTQIAAAVLGLGDQLGYARLVEQLLAITLDKSQSRTDWTRRPLRDKQLSYAIDDVRYLREMYPLLLQELSAKKRLSWLTTAFQQLTDETNYLPEPLKIWQRVRGVQTLKQRHLPILRELAAWREALAINKNRPRRWILSDEVLLDMSRMTIRKPEDFSQIKGLSKDQIKRHAEQWLALIETGKQCPKSEWPALPRRRKLDGHLSLVADLLMVVVNQQAEKHNISSQMLATRTQVEKMLTEGRNYLSEDWRGSLLNEPLSDVLHGRVSLQVEQGHLTVNNRHS